MPCLPGATAVLASSGVTVSMAISEASVRAAVENFVDPYLRQTLEQAHAVRAVELNAGRVLAKIELGFPTIGYTHTLQSALQRHLAAAGLDVELTLELASHIVPHAVQRNLKPLAGVKNIVAVASGKGGVGKSTVAVNGQRVSVDLVPGSFARVDRTWRSGDRIEVEFEATTTLDGVDPQHPDVVAPVNGPLALFAVGEIPSILRRSELQGAVAISSGSSTWQVKSEKGILTLKPFASIGDEQYRLYHSVEA